ncbi:hypothetical protein R1sor_007607 [Riccia sorocarpa]|uniref:CCHC-type domain-containing protein n=1 Tax=Riccia sorocarpa TaxID=122646 RepID=A0ABD3HV38_9MARC
MLGSLGRVLHKDIHRNQNNHVHISACLVIDLSEEVTDTVRVRSNGQVIIEQVVHYRRLPDLCFYCQDRGHWIKDCPRKTVKEIQKRMKHEEDNADQEDEEDTGEAANIPEANKEDSDTHEVDEVLELNDEAGAQDREMEESTEEEEETQENETSEEGREDVDEGTMGEGMASDGNPGKKNPSMTINGMFSPDAQVTAKKRGCENA